MIYLQCYLAVGVFFVAVWPVRRFLAFEVTRKRVLQAALNENASFWKVFFYAMALSIVCIIMWPASVYLAVLEE